MNLGLVVQTSTKYWTVVNVYLEKAKLGLFVRAAELRAGDSLRKQMFWMTHFIWLIWFSRYSTNIAQWISSFITSTGDCLSPLNTLVKPIFGWNSPETWSWWKQEVLAAADGSCSICMVIWDGPPLSPLEATGGNRTVVGKRLINSSRGASIGATESRKRWSVHFFFPWLCRET